MWMKTADFGTKAKAELSSMLKPGRPKRLQLLGLADYSEKSIEKAE